MSAKKAADSGASRSKAAERANTQKKTLPPAMEARKWKPGQSGNPSGRPKKDLSAQMAEEIFEQNYKAIKRAMVKNLRKGCTKTFETMSARKWGKAHQQIDVDAAVTVNFVLDL